MASASAKLHFPARLYQVIEMEDPSIISWELNGTAFRIVDPKRFRSEIIPKYFKHGNMASIQRQLNLYGFRCINRIEEKGVFQHPHFIRGEYDLIRNIRRKKTWPTKKKPFGGPDPEVTPRQQCGGSNQQLPPPPTNVYYRVVSSSGIAANAGSMSTLPLSTAHLNTVPSAAVVGHCGVVIPVLPLAALSGASSFGVGGCNFAFYRGQQQQSQYGMDPIDTSRSYASTCSSSSSLYVDTARDDEDTNDGFDCSEGPFNYQSNACVINASAGACGENAGGAWDDSPLTRLVNSTDILAMLTTDSDDDHLISNNTTMDGYSNSMDMEHAHVPVVCSRSCALAATPTTAHGVFEEDRLYSLFVDDFDNDEMN